MDMPFDTLHKLEEVHPRQARFEGDRVKSVLQAFKLTHCIPGLLHQYHAAWGERRLAFSSFNQSFPTFPILLAARYRPCSAETCRPAALFRAFAQTFLLSDYLLLLLRSEEEARGRPVGLVVALGGIRGGMLVHNGDFATRGTRMFHLVANDAPPHRVTVEPFLTVLEFLAGGGWRPDRPPPKLLPTHGPQVDRSLAVHSWMVRRLGPGPASVILGWLWAVLHSSSGYHRLYICRSDDGQCCVSATQEQIATATGLSQRQVKRGLDSLRREGLIATRSRQGHSHVWLLPGAGQDQELGD
jgi:hypothetical protein